MTSPKTLQEIRDSALANFEDDAVSLGLGNWPSVNEAFLAGFDSATKHLSGEMKPDALELCNSLRKERDELAAENKRLRNALEFVYVHLESMDSYSLVSGARHIVKSALGKEDKND